MSIRETITDLSQRIRSLERASRRAPQEPASTTNGSSELTRLLNEGNWPRGGVVEWLSPPGAGAVELAFHSLSTLLSSQHRWCVVDMAGAFFGLKAQRQQSAERCCIVRPKNTTDMWWAVEQVLRCPGIAVTWCWADKVPDRVLRRWQLAAEVGGGIGMFFRPPEVIRQAPWSDLRLSVTPVSRLVRRSRALKVEAVYCRGRMEGQSVVLEFNHATGAVCVVPELADPATSARRSEAASSANRRVC